MPTDVIPASSDEVRALYAEFVRLEAAETVARAELRRLARDREAVRDKLAAAATRGPAAFGRDIDGRPHVLVCRYDPTSYVDTFRFVPLHSV